MRRKWVWAAVVAWTCVLFGGNVQWAESYDNTRYGVHLPLPAGTFADPQPYGENGTVYRGVDGRSRLIVVVEPLRGSLREFYRKMIRSLSRHNEVTYKKFFGDWFVLSARDPENGAILYAKAYRESGVAGLYLLVYPEEQRWRFDSVIKELNRHFGPRKISKNHSKKVGRTGHLGGRKCDAMARACYADCADGDDRCLVRCENRRDRCYRSGSF